MSILSIRLTAYLHTPSSNQLLGEQPVESINSSAQYYMKLWSSGGNSKAAIIAVHATSAAVGVFLIATNGGRFYYTKLCGGDNYIKFYSGSDGYLYGKGSGSVTKRYFITRLAGSFVIDGTTSASVDVELTLLSS